MKIRRTLFALLLPVLGAAGCSDEARHTLTLTGSSTIAPVMSELAAAFEARHPGWRIDVHSGGSSRGIRDARQGLADAGMVSRALAADEQDLSAHTLAHDGIALIVHADNPVPVLAREAVRRIYRGELRDWSALGGPEGRIMVINKAAGRATLAVFLAHFGLDNRDIRPDLVAGENQQVIQTVAGNPAALGYVSIGTAEHERDSGVPIRLLALDGVAASTANVRSGDYRLSRPLNVVTRGAPNPALAEFMAFWHSPAGVDIIQGQHFVPAGD